MSCDYIAIMDKTSHLTTFTAVPCMRADLHLLNKVQCSAWFCVKSSSAFLQGFAIYGTLKVHGSLKVALVVSVFQLQPLTWQVYIKILAFFFNCWVLQWRCLLFKRLLTAKTRKITLIWGHVCKYFPFPLCNYCHNEGRLFQTQCTYNSIYWDACAYMYQEPGPA